MAWEVVRTETFSRMFKKYRNNAQFTQALDKKIRFLQETPLSLGGALGGHLHGYRSVRLIGKFRLIFRVDEAAGRVHIVAFDHRKFDYQRFAFLGEEK